MGGRQLQEAEGRIRHLVLNGPPGGPGLSDCVTLSPGSPGQAGVPCSRLCTLPASPRPHPPPRRCPGSSGAWRPPGARREGEAGSSHLPGALDETPRELGGHSAAPPGARPPRAVRPPPSGARGAGREARGAERSAHSLVAQEGQWPRGRARRRSPACSPPRVDSRTMAAEGRGPRAQLWAVALLLLGLPRLSVRADGECARGAGGWRVGSGWRKRRSLGCSLRQAWRGMTRVALGRPCVPRLTHRVSASPSAPHPNLSL